MRLLAPLSCCCWSPVSVVDTDAVEGRENVTPFVRDELFESLRSSGNADVLVSGEMDTVAVVIAVVGLDGLILGVNGDGSGRTVMFELAEIFRRLYLSKLFWMSDSDGSVGSDGGTAMGGRARRSGNAIWDCREIGVGEGS